MHYFSRCAYFDFVVSDELLPAAPLGDDVLPEALPPLLPAPLLPLVLESLEPDVPDELGVEEDELEEPGVLEGLVDDPDALDELGELELGLLEELLPLEESLLELEPDIEPEGDDDDEPEAPLDEPDLAPGPPEPPRSQP